MSALGTVGYVVVEACEDFEQMLSLEFDDDKPRDGILCWRDDSHPVIVFLSRRAARAAITRTHHWAIAFGNDKYPKRNYCRVDVIKKVLGGVAL